ncbi:outer membrane lipoprotein carrier protein LolA [Alsobacter sp. SYSU M60028]|uniref:Outer membrane lipoprotein carrier protein LolA n=1 Tax=Alsobacter ponti TaxID=2962936 RepID=A0ABT1LCJ4_9HYPH|nr:outer-membrane lipoprotein carrier protein LolA [Alsobacter ponti]MCP8938661.1 outer membrane lipoprotein carrier protein LolA [Alsobacter ponti]
MQLRPPAAAVAPRPAPAATPAAPARIPLPLPRPAEFASATQPVPVAVPSAASPSPAAAPARVAPAPAAPPATVQPAAVDLSPKTVLERVNVALNAMTTLSADFVQVGGNGRRAEGRLYVQKPGRLRFEYNPPASLEIVADGNSVVIRDGRAGTQDLYGIAQTPLKFLLKEKLDLTRDTRVIDVHPAPDLVSVLLEDRSTFGGTSRIELFFDARTYVLRQWVIVDPQGYQTTVNLRNVDQTHRPDPSLFAIDYTKSMPPQMQSNR